MPKLDKENQEKLNRVRRNLAEMGSNPEGTAYEKVKSALKNLSTETLKGKEAYITVLENIIQSLDNLAEGYANTGDSKLAQKFIAVRNKLLPLRNKIKAGKIRTVDEIKTSADSALRDFVEINPKNPDKGGKAGIRDQSKAFAGFDKKRVKIEIDPKKGFELKKAPMLLIFKNKVTPSQKNVLKALNAHFYQGTNGVSLPSVPVLVLNSRMTSKADLKKTAKGVFKMLGRPDLVAFTDLAVERGGAFAIPVFEPRMAEVMSVIFFDSTNARELWVE